MKKLTTLFTATAFLLFIFMSSCTFNTIKGQGNITESSHSLSGFTKISFEISGDVFLTQSDEFSVKLKAKENLHEHIKFDVENGTLRIYSKKRLRKSGEIKMYISLPVLNAVSIYGSNNVTGKNVFISDKLDINIDGSGNIKLASEIGELNVEINGSGDLNIDGTANFQTITINRSGDVKNFGLITENIKIEINGSGDCEVYANKTLDVEINGSGSVRSKGKPHISSDINGSGDVSLVE